MKKSPWYNPKNIFNNSDPNDLLTNKGISLKRYQKLANLQKALSLTTLPKYTDLLRFILM